MDDLRRENEELKARLDEAEDTLRALRAGEVDALVSEGPRGPQVFILQGSEAESNRLRGEILDSVSDAVIAIDAERRLIYLNAAAEKQYGVSAPEVLGKPASAIIESRWDRPEDEQEYQKILAETGRWRGRNIHVKNDGSVIHVESTVSLLYSQDGTPAGRLGVIRDITDTMAAEEALRENQARLQLTLESARIGDWDLDLKSDKSNRSFLHDQLFGYREPVARWGFRHFLHHVHPEDRDDVKARFRQALENAEGWQAECRIIWPNGTIRWINMHASIFRDEHGEPSRMLGVIFDITPRRQAEEALRENEALFSTIIDQAPGGVYVVDDRFRMMRINPLARPTFVSAEPVIGRDFGEIMRIIWGPEIGRQQTEVFWRTLETGEPYTAPRFTERRRDSGEVKSYDWETRRVTLPNGRHGVVCYFSDVTEQRKLEDALRASEKRANDIIQSISDGFITFDLDWRITYVSAKGAEMLSPLNPDPFSLMGRVLWEVFPEAANGPIERNYLRAMRKQVPVQFEVEYSPLGRWFDVRGYPSLFGLSVYLLDITERRSSEKALAEQATALRAADRSKDEFLAMLAHELRNPLAPLRNATEVLRSPSASPDAQARAQDMMVRQIGNLSRMIDDLLDVSRITQGKIQLHRQPVILQEILTASIAASREACIRNLQKLTFSLPPDPIVIDGDATRLEQVFGNLLGNACKYSGHGTDIWVTANMTPGNTVSITIGDSGIGIDPDVLPRIFDLFVQSSRTLDRSHGGLGIGLTIVNRLVRMHDGSIEAKSAGLGRGAEFTVHLPVLATAALPSAPAATAASVMDRPLRLLIVDDNKDAAETMAMFQQLHGHETRVAHDGPDGITAAEEFMPEVILLDIGLPGMDGFEVARKIRTMPELSRPFLVALTGYGSESDRRKALDAGFDEHLPKPADLDLLKTWFRTRVG